MKKLTLVDWEELESVLWVALRRIAAVMDESERAFFREEVSGVATDNAASRTRKQS
jgi:hypothetical protein